MLYSGRGFRESEIGDIDVIIKEGVYHLFHLILPNHDYIAHAISPDGINWKRTRNALFVGDPGAWDDDMLWTMHLVEQGEKFLMYYTGLSQAEKGFYQRIGLAESKDLYHWEKVENHKFPLAPAGPHYESPEYNAREWVSFRDPYYVKNSEGEYLLFCARIATGSISRRGCVGMAQLHQDSCELLPPLFIPYVYDDVECPCLFEIEGHYYLLGSIREDVKVHYWHSENFMGPYRAPSNNVLMPEGNYAARICPDGEHLLLYAFYVSQAENPEMSTRTLPPPKELAVGEDGNLILRSFWRWRTMIDATLSAAKFPGFVPLLNNPTAAFSLEASTLKLSCESGYEVQAMPQIGDNWIWEGELWVADVGKCGLVFNCDDKGDGYYISLDCVHGFVQVRSWGSNPADIHKDYHYENLQTNNFKPNAQRRHKFSLIRYGDYIELSIDGEVKLALVDNRYRGLYMGVYVETASLHIKKSQIFALFTPKN